ncbi:uncharacterized protein LOC118438644 isoform X1 [Folsomia candida]|uniref:uncharacterized protein LOC118438644 isoform X1 n=1 Tax=Folsomia candida TaxID=158441 RepID=UPI001604CE73|nr:uncharacterized protein LOC118438644 isoform X1 [Folsomia candida]
MTGKSVPLINDTSDATLLILRGTVCSSGCAAGSICVCPDSEYKWEKEAALLNNIGQKYTIGSGKNLDNLDLEKYGQFLIFHLHADVADVQCQIECDTDGNFWFHGLGYSDTFVNGKLLIPNFIKFPEEQRFGRVRNHRVKNKWEDSPVKLKSGDVFYFSYVCSHLWDHKLASSCGRRLYRKNPVGKDYTVFKFERPTPTKSVQNLNDEDSSPPNHPIFNNHIILSKILQNLVSSTSNILTNQTDLLNCRLVSTPFDHVARKVLRKDVVLQFIVDIDSLYTHDANHFLNRLYWKTHRFKHLKFDAMNISIYKKRFHHWVNYSEKPKPTEIKFNQDFSSFINHPDFHPLKSLKIDVDYLSPISTLLVKCYLSLEQLDIQVKLDWILDEKKATFPENLKFPKLRKLTLDFSYVQNNEIVSNSVSLAGLILASNKVEELVIKKYTRLPADFGSFKNLKKITISGRRMLHWETFNFHEFLYQFITLPIGQLCSLKVFLPANDELSTPVKIEESLFQLVENHRRTLQSLEISLNSRYFENPITLPRCMPNLKKLWIIIPDGDLKQAGFIVGVRLSSQKGEKSHQNVDDSMKMPLVLRDGRECTHRFCPSCGDDTLLYGKWHRNEVGF